MENKEFNLSREVITLTDSNDLDDELKATNILKTIDVRQFMTRERFLLCLYKNGTYTWKEFLDKRKKLMGDKFF